MQLLARPPARFRGPAAYGFAAYWGLNLVLLLAELRWHVLSRLTVWEFSTLRDYIIQTAHHVH
jgi:hypothetical protein